MLCGEGMEVLMNYLEIVGLCRHTVTLLPGYEVAKQGGDVF